MDYSGYLHSGNEPATSRDASSPKSTGNFSSSAAPVIIELFGVARIVNSSGEQRRFSVIVLRATRRNSRRSILADRPRPLWLVPSSWTDGNTGGLSSDIAHRRKYQLPNSTLNNAKPPSVHRRRRRRMEPSHYSGNFSTFSSLFTRRARFWAANRSGSICRRGGRLALSLLPRLPLPASILIILIEPLFERREAPE